MVKCTWINAPFALPDAAVSMSASFRTMALALPPNSSSTGFTCLPAKLAIMPPTSVLPVKLIFFTARCAIRALVTSAASEGRW